MISKGFSVSAIADKLSTTRQYVNQTRLTAEAKLSTTLLEVARANNLQVTRLYPKEAILLRYHPALNRKAIVTCSTSYGIKVWYWHDNPEEVTNEDFLRQTRNYLLDIAKRERNRTGGRNEDSSSQTSSHSIQQANPRVEIMTLKKNV